jgi:hypothetical protein
MKKPFNDNAPPRPHHYILKLSATAGADRDNPADADKPPFQQAVLFLQRLKKWIGEKGEAAHFRAEILPVTDDDRPRLRIACPPALMDDICNFFTGRISRVDEIPLPKPPKPSRPLWKRIFGA